MRDEPRDPLRIAFYTRISTDEDHQKYSLGAQKDRLEAFCKAQWDDAWRLHTVYRDTESGTHMHRPGLEEMLDDAAAQAFDTLLVFRVDRLSRKVRELAQMVDELTKNGVTLKSITEPFDTSNPAGKMMLQMLGVFAEFEHATIVERTKVGMEKKARGGGVVPYGYQLDPEKGLVLAQDEAVIVKKMFKMYAVGKEGTHTIGHTLNGAGYRNRRGKKWDKRVILNMIKNPLYVGKLRWKDVLYEGTHDPIIADVLFEKTQAILQQRAQDLNGRRFHNRDARLLAGTITCARCQSHMVGVSTHKKARRFPYYICSKRWNIKDCDQDYVRADLLEAGIMRDVKTVFRDEAFMARIWDEANRRLSAEKPDVDQELGKVETQAAQTQARIDRYFEAFEAGTLKPALCNEKVQRLTARLEELEAERQALEGRRQRLALPVIDKETLSGVVANFEDVMAAGTTPQQKHVLHHLVKKVLVHDRRTVEVWYGLPNPPSVSRPGKLAPLMSRSTNRRSSLTEPEIWFKIVHITPEIRDVRPETTDREQTVEITLGPKGTFENGNIGTLMRRVPADRAVSAVPPCRGKPKRPQEPKTPRVAELLRKAIEWRALLTAGEVATQAAIARHEGITRARVTQILGLLRLAPEIQHHILSMPEMVGRPSITERALRRVTQLEQLGVQRQAFQQLVGQHSA